MNQTADIVIIALTAACILGVLGVAGLGVYLLIEIFG